MAVKSSRERHPRTIRELPGPDPHPLSRLATTGSLPVASRRSPGGRRSRPGPAAPRSKGDVRGASTTILNVLGLRPVPGRRPMRPRWPRILVLLVAAYAAFALAASGARYMALAGQIRSVHAQVAALHARDAELRLEETALTKPTHIADSARKWFGLVSPGDLVFTPVQPGQ